METKVRNRVRTAGTEALLWAATAGQLVFGVLTGILLLGLVPQDGTDFNVLGSLVLMAFTGPAALACWRFRVRHGDN